MTRPQLSPIALAERAINLLDAGRLDDARDLLEALPELIAALVEEATDLAYEDGARAAGPPVIKIAHAQHRTLQ